VKRVEVGANAEWDLVSDPWFLSLARSRYVN
jgi:hypothetical protein